MRGIGLTDQWDWWWFGGGGVVESKYSVALWWVNVRNLCPNI